MNANRGFGAEKGLKAAAYAFFICSALAGYADQFGDFTYVEYDTYIEITDSPDDATGDVIIPSDIVGKPVTRIGFRAFAECRNLTSVTMGSSVTSIGYWAFGSCTSLTSVTIPDSVTTSIGKAAFSYCSSLTSVTIGDSVTSIGNTAFLGCKNLASVTIPDNVTSIGDLAFRSGDSLVSVYFEGNAPILEQNLFGGSSRAIVYYLSGTTGWGETFGGRPTVEISVLPDLLIGGTPLDGLEGWFLSEWWGEYKAAYALWLYHAEHGFIYRHPSSTNASLDFYDDAMGAWWL